MKTKYDWSDVPLKVNWIATDSNGNVFGYDIKPKMMEYGNFMHVSDFLYFPKSNWISPYKGNWMDSLEERPK